MIDDVIISGPGSEVTIQVTAVVNGQITTTGLNSIHGTEAGLAVRALNHRGRQ